MRILLIVLLASCVEVENNYHLKMIIVPDSVPVKLWPIADSTFNETEICGVNPACFCQPYNCDDPISIYFSDTVDRDYYVNVFDQNGNELLLEPMDQVLSGGVYYYSYTLYPNQSSPTFCNTKLSIYVVTITSATDEEEGSLSNFEFINTISPWAELTGTYWEWSDDIAPNFPQYPPGFYNWIRLPAGDYASDPNPGIDTSVDNDLDSQNNTVVRSAIVANKGIGHDKVLNSGEPVRIRFRINTSFVGDYSVHILAVSTGNIIAVKIAQYDFTGNFLPFEIDSIEIVPESTLPTGITSFDKIFIVFTGGWGAINECYIDYFDALTGDSIQGLPDNLKVLQQYLKSDCIHVKDSHDCTTLLEYTNSKNFDDIFYEDSPQPVFSLRIPSQFWKENNPQTQEDLNLSNGEIVTLRQEIQEKTLLEIGYVPNFMHKKIQKVLMYDQVTINGTQWKKRDSYESENIERYPLKRGSVWLTQYTSVERNTL